MKANHMFAMLNEDVTTIDITFKGSGGKPYRYMTLKSEGVQEHDKVIIHNGVDFGIGTVKEVHLTPNIDTTSNVRYKFIVGRVDVERYDTICHNQIEQETKFNELEARRKAKEAIVAYAEQTGMDIAEIRSIACSITSNLTLENNEDDSTNNN